MLATGVLAGCSLWQDDGPVRVVALGTLHRDPARMPMPRSMPDRLFLDATGQSLVSLSADGQVEAGLAERWTVIDNGRSYIFRLREARWADGRRVRSSDVAAILRARVGASRLPPQLAAEFAGIESIQAMTARVIEIRLKRPMPDLLELLAQPDVVLTSGGSGWGPLTPEWQGRSVLLRLDRDMRMTHGMAEAAEDAIPAVQLWGMPTTASALAQIDAGAADVLTGGRFTGWPLVRAAGLPGDQIILDPVDGLFGLAVSGTGITADRQVREAIAMAIDRAAIQQALAVPGWRARITIRPVVTGLPDPVYPAWQALSAADRRQRARAAVRTAGAAEGRRPIRVALPDGPGARILFARLRTDLNAVGFDTRRVPLSANAELRLIDEIAPGRDPGWYLRRIGCRAGIACDADSGALLLAVEDATSPAERANAVIAAEDALMRHGGFVPLGAPVRWAVRSNRATPLVPNRRGFHGLYRLLPAPH